MTPGDTYIHSPRCFIIDLSVSKQCLCGAFSACMPWSVAQVDIAKQKNAVLYKTTLKPALSDSTNSTGPFSPSQFGSCIFVLRNTSTWNAERRQSKNIKLLRCLEPRGRFQPHMQTLKLSLLVNVFTGLYLGWNLLYHKASGYYPTNQHLTNKHLPSLNVGLYKD